MVSEHHLSERRACRLVGLSRDSYRHPPQADQATVELHEKIVEIALVRRRFGYRRIHDLLRPQFPGVNHKRVYRLYRQANLAVRRRKKGKRPVNERVPLQLARTVNEVWSMDFVKLTPFHGHFRIERESPKCPKPNHRTHPGFASKWSNWSEAAANPASCPKNLAVTPPAS